MTKLLSFTIIFLFGIYTFYLSITSSLGFYIHPRYYEFSQAGAYISIFVGLSGIIITLQKTKFKHLIKDSKNLANFVPFSLFIIILILGFLIPPQTLSSRAASNRASSDSFGANATQQTIFDSFIRTDETYTISDWIAELYRNPDLKSYSGRKVDIVGFVYRSESLAPNEFLVGRFVIRCCIVDATPIGLIVSLDDAEAYLDNSWVRVRATFEVKEIDGKDSLRLIPELIEEVDQPDSPYIY